MAARAGRPPCLSARQRAALTRLIRRGPPPERDGVSAWRVADLRRRVERRFGVSSQEGGLRGLLHGLGLSWQSDAWRRLCAEPGRLASLTDYPYLRKVRT